MKAKIHNVRKHGLNYYEATLTNNDGTWYDSATFMSVAGARDWLVRKLYAITEGNA